MSHSQAADALENYGLLDALRGRRSRRFGRGMKIGQGPLAFTSQHAPTPLSEEEEALLVFAASGINGYALRDLEFGETRGGAMMAGAVSRTASSPDAINCVSLFVTNDEATYLIKRPQDFTPAEVPDLLEMAQKGAWVELYRRMRVKVKDGRAAPPLDPPLNIKVNLWSLYQPGCTYFIPVNELTYLYINGMIEMFEKGMGLYVIDERANLQPAGLARFGRSQGGELYDDMKDGRTVSITTLEFSLAEIVNFENGMMLQNLGLMAQALGLGAFPNFARHESAWCEALGFRLEHMPATKYLGANPLITAAMGLLKKDIDIPFPVGLEQKGQPLLKSYCPPYFPSMREAVMAVVESKFGPQGFFRGQATSSRWREPGQVAEQIPPHRQEVVEAVIAFCQYVYDRYGRFPGYIAPFRTVAGYQVSHVDIDFYDKYYEPAALTATQREHMGRWHASGPTTGVG